jgi:hypothetical protein
MISSTVELNKGFSHFLGIDNAKKLFPKGLIQTLMQENSACCGIGRKEVRFKRGGAHTSVFFPVSYGGAIHNNENDFCDAIAAEYGTGYVVYLKNPSILVVLSNKSHKDSEGVADVDDFIYLP